MIIYKIEELLDREKFLRENSCISEEEVNEEVEYESNVVKIIEKY